MVIPEAVGDYLAVVLVFGKLYLLFVKPDVKLVGALFKTVYLEVIYLNFEQYGSE